MLLLRAALQQDGPLGLAALAEEHVGDLFLEQAPAFPFCRAQVEKRNALNSDERREEESVRHEERERRGEETR